MGLLGRKKREEEEELGDEESKIKPLVKKKRIPPEAKEKLPEKSWGRKERLWILVILLLTVSMSGTLALSARSWKLPGFPRIKTPKLPEISFISDETVVIEGNKENLEKSGKISQEFKSFTKNLSGVYGLYVIHLSDGYSFGVNENEVFEPASLNKLPLIIAAYRSDERGEIDLQANYVLKDSDKVLGSGSLSSMGAGTVYTYRELLNFMGQQSDNTSFNVLRRLVGEENINRTIEEIGMVSTSLIENKTTPKDIGIYFEKLYKGNLLENSAKSEVLESLADTVYENHIPAGIPEEVKAAHIYGRGCM